jgi:acyl dehydratase
LRSLQKDIQFMAIHYSTLRNWRFDDTVDRYAARDCMLYALSLGYGSDPLDESELPFVHEEGTLVVPTLLATVGAPGAWARDPGTGIDWLKILHGEHRMHFHRPLQPQAALRSSTRISHVVDKGAGKGALVITRREISDAVSGLPVATIDHTSFCRADGGFSEGSAGTDEAPAPLAKTPETAPDAVVLLDSLPQSALLYRLNGDLNPIHILPGMARQAGFDRPILHGLCTFGMAARAVLRACSPQRPERLRSFGLRFSAPFFPGETLRVEMWRRQDAVLFRALSEERGVVVLSNGVAGFGEPDAGSI